MPRAQRNIYVAGMQVQRKPRTLPEPSTGAPGPTSDPKKRGRPRKTRWICSDCSAGFDSRDELRRHPCARSACPHAGCGKTVSKNDRAKHCMQHGLADMIVIEVSEVDKKHIDHYLNNVNTFGVKKTYIDQLVAQTKRDEIRNARYSHLKVGDLIHVVCLKNDVDDKLASCPGRVSVIACIGSITEGRIGKKKIVTYKYREQYAYEEIRGEEVETLEKYEMPPTMKCAPGVTAMPAGPITGPVLYKPALAFMRKCASSACAFNCRSRVRGLLLRARR